MNGYDDNYNLYRENKEKEQYKNNFITRAKNMIRLDKKKDIELSNGVVINYNRQTKQILHIRLPNGVIIDDMSIIGYSNAIVYLGKMGNIKVAVKITTPRDSLFLTDDKLVFLNANNDLFTKIYYSFRNGKILSGEKLQLSKEKEPVSRFKYNHKNNIISFEVVNIYIMEYVDITLDKFFNNSNIFSDIKPNSVLTNNTICNLYHFLLRVVERLTAAGLYYFDIKLENIGIINIHDNPQFIMIDLDSILSIEDVTRGAYLSTLYTDGAFNSRTNFWRAEMIAVFNTIIVALSSPSFYLPINYKPLIKGIINNNEYTRLGTLINSLTPLNSEYGDYYVYRTILFIGAFMMVYNMTRNVNLNELTKVTSFLSRTNLSDPRTDQYADIMTELFLGIFVVFLPYSIHDKIRLLRATIRNTNTNTTIDYADWNGNEYWASTPAHVILHRAENVINDTCGNDRCGAIEYILATFKIPGSSYYM